MRPAMTVFLPVVSLYFLTASQIKARRETAFIEKLLDEGLPHNRNADENKNVFALTGGSFFKSARNLEEKRMGGESLTPRELKKAKAVMICFSAFFAFLFFLKMPFPLNSLGPLGTLILIGKAPDILTKRRSARELASMAREIPEVVDLLNVLCLSGMSIQAAFRSIPESIQHEALKEEFMGVVERLKLGESFARSLEDLLHHPLPELSRLAKTLVRADEQGVPVSVLLECLAKEMKSKRRAFEREKAAKASLAILFPLVFLILPSFLLLTLGGVISGFFSRGP